MKYTNRALEAQIKRKCKPNKVLILLGARRIGKTTLIRRVAASFKQPVLFLNGEDVATSDALKVRSVANYKRVMGKRKILIIDEAQKIPDIGAILKLMVDEIQGIQIIATGSSMFDLSGKLGEPLTGRSNTVFMYPLAQMELSNTENLVQTKANLEERLIYGSYPELLQCTGNDEKADYLMELVNSYLLKDILSYDGIRNSGKMIDLLRLIAFQIGKEVSMDELGRQLGMSKNTVERHLDLLTKVFVIYKVKAFSGNPRKEISKSSKWYFVDNGIRNALIANFNPINLRNDIGELWENYLLSERLKFHHYSGFKCNTYFWRTYQQQEIDWIEQHGGLLHAYELKWNEKRRSKIPSAWKQMYPKSKFETIHRENYLDWIT